MQHNKSAETRNLWNRLAEDWDIQVGEHGDSNRQLNSDPVLWRFAGDVSDLKVLDAGCGTGYLSKKLKKKGADVIGIDFSEKMIAIANAGAAGIDFRVDDCTLLSTIASETQDLVLSNYVLMDVPDLESCLQSFFRVLKPGGRAVAVFSHPCFPQSQAETLHKGQTICYSWDYSYFTERRCVDPPWNHFRERFVRFHRPLSNYWKAFVRTGFQIEEFEEPQITADRHHLADSERSLQNIVMRPYSVAFLLRKP